jgi:DNA-binding MarR family transcriptional regulator
VEKNILLKIVGETVCRGLYYTFLTQEEIAEDIGCTRKSVYNALKTLIREGWIATQQSQKYTKRNIIDFNVAKAMALGTKHTRKNLPTTKKQVGKNYPTEENYTNSSNEELCSAENATCTRREEILENVKRRRRKPAMRMTGHSLGQTWKNACARNELCTSVHFTITEKDKHRLSMLTGNSRCRAKWKRPCEELHEITSWCVTNWDYCWRRMKYKNMPKLPSTGYFVACFNKFYEIWLDNLKDIHPSDERVTYLKDHLDKKEKWRNYEF